MRQGETMKVERRDLVVKWTRRGFHRYPLTRPFDSDHKVYSHTGIV